MKFACHHLNREVSGFGVAYDPERPLYIDDFAIISQCSHVTFTSIAEDALATYYEEMADRGFEVKQFGRVWIHTHPEMSASPSSIDENTFIDRFGDADWAVMAIMSKTGDSYARLKINNFVIRTEQKLSWHVDWDAFNSAQLSNPDFSAWARELHDLVELPSLQYEHEETVRWQMAAKQAQNLWPDRDFFAPLQSLGSIHGFAETAGLGAAFENG